MLMTATIILFLLLLTMAGGFIWTLSARCIRRFLPLRRATATVINLCCTAVFLLAACTGGIFSLNALRNEEYTRGVTAGVRAGEADLAAQQKLTDRAWQEGYGEGFTAGVSSMAAFETDSPAVQTPSDNTENQELPDSEDKITQTEDAESDLEPLSDSSEEAPPSSEPESAEPASEDPVNSDGESGSTVYYTPSGSVLHRDPDCSYLSRAKEVLSCDMADAPALPFCSRCG